MGPQQNIPQQAPVNNAKFGNTVRGETKPPYDLVPVELLSRGAERFRLGLDRYGLDNWKKCLTNREVAGDFILDAYNHMVEHVMKLGKGDLPADDDDLGAVIWACAVIAHAEAIHGRHFWLRSNNSHDHVPL